MESSLLNTVHGLYRGYLLEIQCDKCAELEIITFDKIMLDAKNHTCINLHGSLKNLSRCEEYVDYVLKRVETDRWVILDVVKKLYGKQAEVFIRTGVFLEPWYISGLLVHSRWDTQNNGLLLFYKSMIENTKLLYNVMRGASREAENYASQVLEQPSAEFKTEVDDISLPPNDSSLLNLDSHTFSPLGDLREFQDLWNFEEGMQTKAN